MAWEKTEIEQTGKEKYIPSVFIAVPYKGNFSLNFFRTLYTIKVPPNYDIGFDGGSRPLDLSRNILVTMALRGNFEYILFIDSDIVIHDTDIINKLLQKKQHIVGSPYFTRASPDTLAGTGLGEKRLTKEDLTGELKEVESIGMGCTLIHANVFHKIGENRKWRCLNNHINEEKDKTLVHTLSYEEAMKSSLSCPLCKDPLVAKFFDYTHGKFSGDEDDEDGFPIPVCSEDYYFCNVARRNGFKSMLATDLTVYHEASNWLIGKEGFVTTSKGSGI